ncbi:metallophosphoesterase family protein [Schwartzia sp. (in: firmicutes)]
MNRREFLRLMAMGAGWLFGGWYRWPGTAVSAPKRDYYHIVLLSDLHLPWRRKSFPEIKQQTYIWEQKQKLIANINSWEDVDEVALLGDLAARYGKEYEFACVDEFLSEIKAPWYAVAGNHDYAYRDDPGPDGSLQRGTYEERCRKLAAFTRRYNLPDVYYARTVGRYRLLYLAPDACTSKNIELSDAQLSWMEKEISANQDKTMLFFCHAPLMGTLRNYWKKINTPSMTAQPEGKLKAVLASCPKGSLWLSGHTHTPPTNDSYADDSVNRFNDNLVDIHNPTMDAKTLYSNSLYLYEDHTVIRTYDHTNGVWLVKLERSYDV